MGLLPPIMLAALLIVAFALTSQQKLAIASHTGPAPARQIAHLMLVYHQASVRQAMQGATGIIANPPPYLDAGFRFTSCADTQSVVTFAGGPSANASWAGGAGAYQNQSIARELVLQSLSPRGGDRGPFIPTQQFTGNNGAVPQTAAVPGIGLSTGPQIQAGAGLVTLPAGCAVAAGLPAIQTRVLP